MRISIKSKLLRLVIATGEDADEVEAQPAVEWIQMDDGSFEVAPDADAEDTGGDGEGSLGFGFNPKMR